MADTEADRAQAARAKQLATLDKLARSFGQSLSKALSINVGAGRQLDSVLVSLAGRLTGVAATAALKPVKAGIAGLVNGLLGTGSETTRSQAGASWPRAGSGPSRRAAWWPPPPTSPCATASA